MKPFYLRLLTAIFLLVAMKTTGAETTPGATAKPAVVATNEVPTAGSNSFPVQMLVPGFTVRELPLHLNNINNFVYAPDGRLFALAYNGNVWQLKDTDGDGLEDTTTYFYKNESNSIPPSIGMAWGPGGLYIASHGRLVRLRDKGDGTSELETVTSGWAPPSFPAGSGLDAVGVTVDAAGNIYFGLGCDAWAGEYKVDKETDKSGYNIYSARGTIEKLSPDWQRRETIATGVRFTVSLAMNAAGDLFCTDQEGATWLPNGNPFDELLHIQPGRHYGFPPRHPRYLPVAIDEPSTFDYSPQHQSTCGLHFNEPTGGGGTVFGPDWWRGNAIVSGESRGKLWRTKLVKTPAGYVAQSSLIGCLNMLTVDAVPTPQGDLLVSCHSGSPDWGTGPEGKGRLYKISYADKKAPQPVFAYAASPTETRVVFDLPLDATRWKNLAAQSRVTVGRYVTAGDRFESFRPGYQVVQDQLKLPRSEMNVLSAGITADGREVLLRTAPRVQAINYAVKLPDGTNAERSHNESRHELPQESAIDVLTDLTGAEAEWRDRRGRTGWSGWVPHLDLQVARALTEASADHARLFRLLDRPGTLVLRTKLDLWLALHPMTQPNAKLDYEYPQETVTVIFRSEGVLTVNTTAKVTRVSNHELRLIVQPHQNEWLPVDLVLATGGRQAKLDVSFITNEDPRERPLALRRFFLPWAVPYGVEATAAGPRQVPEIAGGDWKRGKKLFFGEPVACFKCHQVNGEGGKIGPDLSNLTQRDYASVLKDITQPSAAINPDHIAYNVTLKDGTSVSGVVQSNTTDNVVLGQVTGVSISIPQGQIESMKASSISLMPEGLLPLLNAQQQKDLMTFLLMPPSDK